MQILQKPDTLELQPINRQEALEKPTKASLPKFEGNSPYLIMQATPKQYNSGSVTEAEADQALKNIFNNSELTVGKLGKIDMDQLMMVVTNEVMRLISFTSESKIEQIKNNTKAQEIAKNESVAKLREQIQKEAEESKPKAGGVFANIFNWIISLAETIVGIVKVVTGALRCAVGDVTGAADVASGAAYLTAGIAGLVKAAAESCLLAGVGDKDTLKKVMSDAGKVQTAFEVVGMACDLYQAGSAIFAARGIGKTAGAVVKEVGSELGGAIAKNATGDISSIAKSIGKEVANEWMQTGFKRLSNLAAEKALPGTAQSLFKRLGKEAVEEMTQKAVEKAVKEAMKEGSDVAIDTLANNVTKELNRQVASAAIKATTFGTFEAVRGSAGSAQQITTGALQAQKATFLEDIKKLGLSMEWFQHLYEMHTQQKEELISSVKEDSKKLTDAVKGASQLISDTGSLRSQIANITV